MRHCDACGHRSLCGGLGCPWCGRRAGVELVAVVEHEATGWAGRVGAWWERAVDRLVDALDRWVDRQGRRRAVAVIR